jgi:uncharacterized protein (TIGR03437 family)
MLFGQAGIALVGAGYVNPIPVRVAPGQVVTFFLTGLQTVLPPPFRAERAPTVPLPLALAGISATIRQSGPGTSLLVPLLSVEQLNTCSDPAAMSPECMLTAVTLQVPFELKPRNPLVMTPIDLIGTTEIEFVENGLPGRQFRLSPMMDSIHVLTNCGNARTDDSGAFPCQSLVTHADGNLVSVWGQPAKPGEELVIYAYGLGSTAPAAETGAASPWGALATPVRIDLDFRPNAGISRPGSGTAATYQPTYVGLAAGSVGLYQVNFQVPQPPQGTPPCGSGVDSNLTVTIQGFQSFDGAKLCVQTQ